ncbi:TetR/AcrR family transcriptional regulator [Novosphingobium tardum]|uniref:TetR/AcrR family transcriptional regulator n=1 Tax=Novosphingobium tardum TaxID=1538021 RepID=A0ABV8RPY4_9SPHN
MVTVSTSKIADRGYHHGDLRPALVAAGLKLIETTDADSLSLRAVAREVGVSPTAVYRHFPDKQALMAALAEEGLARLGAAQREAAERGGADAFGATGRAYVRFALANPSLFRLTFTHSCVSPGELNEDAAAEMLQANAMRLAGGDPAEAALVALRAWAIAHGLAMLMLDGRVPPSDDLIDAAIDSRALFPQPQSPDPKHD